MNDQVLTAKIINKNDKTKTVYTINATDFDKEKHEYAFGVSAGGLKPLDPTKKEALFGSSKQPSTWNVDGKVVQLGTIVAQAHKESGLTVEEWNKQPQAEIEAKIQAVVDKVIPSVTPYTVGNRGRGQAMKFFVIDTATGKPIDENETFPTEAAALNKIDELVKAK